MDKVTSTLIDFVEAAYDFEIENDAWLRHVVSSGLPLLDQGLGVGALSFARPLDGSKVTIHEMYVASGPEDFPERNLRFTSRGSAEVSQAMTRPGMAMTLTECAGDRYLADVERWRECFDYSKDAFGLTAVDPSGEGVQIIAPLAEVATLSPSTRLRWQMIGAHLAAGYRLRVAAARTLAKGHAFPHGAEAVLDPKSFCIAEGEGEARSKSTARALREAAIRVDRARGKLRRDNPVQALQIWRGLARGRWSIVDWFDTDGRRYILAIPNPPELRDPRALSKRESQVVAFAALGESHKLIGYRLGIARSTVTNTMRSAMRKLGVSTQAQLVAKMRGLPLDAA